MEKLRFALDVENDWPPVATESVWCKRTGHTFELQNAPFFIKGLARGDKFTATPDPVNGCIFDFNIVEASGHSLVWVLKNEGTDFSQHRSKFEALECSIEGFPAFNLWAIDVPSTALEDQVDAVLAQVEEHGFAVATPVWRY